MRLFIKATTMALASCIFLMSSTPVQSWSQTSNLLYSGKSRFSKLTSHIQLPSRKKIYEGSADKSRKIAKISSLVLDTATSDVAASGETSSKNGPEITFGSSGYKLNWYGFIYGFLGISLGIFWYIGLVLCELLYKVIPPWGKEQQKHWFDPNRRIPTFISHIWGMTVMALTGCLPIIKGRENLKLLYDKERKKYRSAMFVANHTSWMDIYFVAAALGLRHYRMVAKQELMKVPILSRSMKTCEHIVLDRTSRRSQLGAYKKVVRGLKLDGLCIITFPEGTRSRSGILGSFKSGAFKMAKSGGAPIVPLSISYAQDIHPSEYVFPIKPSRFGKRKGAIHIGKPIETIGKSDEELVAEVREKMIEKLPESQRPAL